MTQTDPTAESPAPAVEGASDAPSRTGRPESPISSVLTRDPDRRSSRWVHDLVSAVLVVAPMLLAAAAVAGLAGLVALAGDWGWYVWVILAPLLYLSWLGVFLLITAFVCGQVGKRNPKPAYAVVHPGLERNSKELLGMLTAAMCYRRLGILQSLPLVSLISQYRTLGRLVLRSYSPSEHIGEHVVNWGFILDPDLTHVGAGSIIGAKATIAAHSTAVRGEHLVFVSARVTIGTRATVGGDSYLSLGCVVGDDAVVEPASVVEPFTRIPAGEVWGGNPARFRRRRDDLHLDPTIGR